MSQMQLSYTQPRITVNTHKESFEDYMLTESAQIEQEDWIEPIIN